MLLEIRKEAAIAASEQACWELVGDARRLSGCIPGVSGLTEVEPEKQYKATISDKLGPFRLQLPVTIAITEREAPTRIVAEITGDDGRGQARVKGRLEAALAPVAEGTSLVANATIEVLGKLAALGATPMRRRADETFTTFVREVKAQLEQAAV